MTTPPRDLALVAGTVPTTFVVCRQFDSFSQSRFQSQPYSRRLETQGTTA